MNLFKLLPLIAAGALMSACGTPNSGNPVPQLSQAGVHRANTVSAPYTCKASSHGGTFHWSVEIEGVTASYVAPGGKVTMTGFQWGIQLSPKYVNKLISQGIGSGRMQSKALYINATDAKAKTVNAAYPPIESSDVTLEENTPAVFTLPTYPITIGTWVAAKPGTMNFTSGVAQLTLVSDSSKTVPLQCKPSPAKTISTTTVS